MDFFCDFASLTLKVKPLLLTEKISPVGAGFEKISAGGAAEG